MSDTLPPKPFTTPVPADEAERLAALHRYKVLDTPPEAAFDRITRLAARLFDMPIALISLVDESRAWFKSCVGFGASEVPRDATLCSFAVLTDEPLIIPDARLDDRFACNPFVQAEPGVRFYAGAPLLNHDGFNLGTLCLLDGQPRNPLSSEQQATLVDLAAMVVDELELRLAAHQLAQIDAALRSITQGVATVTGEAFFDALVQHFAQVLDVDYAYIGLIDEGDDPKMLRTIATCAHGQIVENLEYPLQDTPCYEVIQQRKICCYPCHVQAHFPNAPLLKPLSIESYVAVPFFDSNGTPLGLLGVMDGNPLENGHLAESLLTIFADRIATELERQQAEVALRKSEAEYRLLFESIDEGFCVVEVLFDAGGAPLNHRILQANPAFEQQTGIANPEGKTASELVPGLEQYWNDLYAQVIHTGKSIRIENRSDALNRWFDVLVSRVGAAAMRQVAIVFTDISDRKQAEEALRRSEERFQTFMNHSPAAYWITDRDGRVLYLNQTYFQMFQFVTQDVIGKTVHDIYPTDVAQQFLDNIQQAADTHQVVETTEIAPRFDGTMGEFLVYKFPITHETEDVLVGGVAIDITDRKQAEATILQREAQFRQLADAMPQQVWIADAQGNTQYVNQQWITYTGLTLEQTQDIHYVTQVIHPNDFEVTSRQWSTALATGTSYQAEFRLKHQADNTYRWFLSRAIAIHDEQEQIVQWFGTSTDIEEFRRTQAEREQLLQREQTAREAAENANRIKDEFLAVLSHELRSPLNPILGWSQLLQQGKLDTAKTATALETIERNAKLQVQLIDDLLDISRILRGKLSLTMMPVDLSTVISAALETVRLAAEAKAIQIQTTRSPGIGIVLGDAGRLQQVVWNLLSNAVKFTPASGQVTVTLSSTDSQAHVQVTDTGKGIKPDFLPYVFEHFRQEDGATTRKFGGLGLGLAIVRQIVELHGGTVAVNSLGEGKGTTFTVQLPLAPHLNGLPETKLPPSSTKDLSGIRILVVDDEADSREFVAFVLEQAGAIVTIVSSGIEALQALPNVAPDLIVSDIGMPEMDGYMLMRQIRARLEGKQMPAIALTAYAGEVDQQQAIAAGFQRHFSKPIDPEEVMKTISALCSSTFL